MAALVGGIDRHRAPAGKARGEGEELAQLAHLLDANVACQPLPLVLLEPFEPAQVRVASGGDQPCDRMIRRSGQAGRVDRRPVLRRCAGRIPGRWGLWIAMAWTVVSMLWALALGPWVFGAAVVGMILAWVYSAPPLRLKQNGWLGAAACGLCYETLPWFTGAAALIGAAPDGGVIGIALLYGLGAHGIMTLNDFKSVAGDRRMGIGSLPVRMGEDGAGALACFMMAAPQIVVMGLLFGWGLAPYAWAIGVLLLVQLVLMEPLLENPRERAPWYNATGTTLYVIGMMVSAFAVSNLAGAS